MQDSYFNWLLGFVCLHEFDNSTNIDICRELFNTEFRWLLERDENRAGWGIELRNRFLYDNDISGNANELLELDKCTVLEMLVALAIDMDKVLYDDKYGTRIHEWFWLFMGNLGIENGVECDDLESKLDIFMDRKYTYQGNGNIIFLPDTKKDLRKVEIWFQVCWYINAYLQI